MICQRKQFFWNEVQTLHYNFPKELCNAKSQKLSTAKKAQFDETLKNEKVCKICGKKFRRVKPIQDDQGCSSGCTRKIRNFLKNGKTYSFYTKQFE